MENKKKFKVVTLGCRTNQYESQAYADQLIALGFLEAKKEEKADICIVNTCTVTHSADSSSRHEIRHLARKNPDAKIVVTGCLSERLPQEIGAMPEVDLIVPNKEKEDLLSHLFPGIELPEFAIRQFADHTRAFVKVQDGCDSFCTYCIIPYVRGRSRSRSIAEVVKEVEGLISSGYKEVVLTGINIGDFDGGVEKGEPPIPLSELVSVVDSIQGLERLRLSSIDPDEVDEELSRAILKGKRTCHSMHIVLLAERLSFDLRSDFVGRTMDVLIEKGEDLIEGCVSGHTENFLTVCIPQIGIEPNTVVKVELTENHPKALLGKIIS
ncbi:MAG: radical SAM protein [Chlamydiales bacterium]|nr:radical SAM protein [Chlamydiales bacterium]